MRGYATEAALRTALEQRLRDVAREREVPVVRLRKAVVFERFLARLKRRTAVDDWGSDGIDCVSTGRLERRMQKLVLDRLE